MRERTRVLYETVVGAVALVVLSIGLAWGFGGGRGEAPGYTLTARFAQVDGLSEGSPVMLAGMRIGEVTGLSLGDRMRPMVGMRIRHGVEIPVDSAAMVLSDGILGAKFLNILPGVDDAAMQPGDRFEFVQDAVIVERLLQRIVENAEQRRRGDPGPDGGDPPSPRPE